ncbi:hypothetical protein SAMN05444266_109256 [Chitinophaga jiangningensis]|uniref:Uncharacterized protein n=1 Tax=Chitinophaga jiangningensis TaxID=1419482 RepID=A0A1M7KCY3_9BACT|nr:hypothetical protein [Chitinophaga jiangningensis]SHM63109.1 hypothetical protein SAMN05444266_109256 [Chitinophaga jiangningensis]
MLLVINDHKSLGLLQQEFSSNYPFLKLSFYDKPHGILEATEKSHQLSARMLVREVRNLHHSGTLTINPDDTVYSIERAFRDRFNLNVQVCRRNTFGWVQTSGSDLVTLGEQNEIGRTAVEKKSPGTRNDFLDDEY